MKRNTAKRGIETGIKEMRDGKLLTRYGKEAFLKAFTRAQKKTITELKKHGLSYTEEQIFNMKKRTAYNSK